MIVPYLVIFIVAAAIVYFVAPIVMKLSVDANKSRGQEMARAMERSIMADDLKRVSIFYVIGPFVLGGLGLLLFPSHLKLPMMIVGIVLGILLPRMYTSTLIGKRRKMFNNQLVDALMIMSSSFRGGLSLIQSIETVADEMPDPIRQEFSLVVGENKMGVPMDETLSRLYDRNPSPAMQQMVSAILLARETGGNLPVIFSRIIATIRERKKIMDNIAVLTLQGKIQAAVMSLLPLAFFFVVQMTNPRYFEVMMTTSIGRKLMIGALILWMIGVFFIIKFSNIKDY